MDNNFRDLVRYLGSRTAAVGFLLFWFGCAALFISGLAWTLAKGANNQELPPIELIAIPVWGVMAVPLGLFLRRGNRDVVWVCIAVSWLSIAVVFIFALKFGIDPFAMIGLPSPF